MTASGTHECDRCGTNVGNGAITECAIVSALDKNTGMVVNFHFCVSREEGGKMVTGCAAKVLSGRNLQHYEETREREG